MFYKCLFSASCSQSCYKTNNIINSYCCVFNGKYCTWNAFFHDFSRLLKTSAGLDPPSSIPVQCWAPWVEAAGDVNNHPSCCHFFTTQQDETQPGRFLNVLSVTRRQTCLNHHLVFKWSEKDNVKTTNLMLPLRRLITTPVIFITPLLISSSRAWLMAARRRPSRLFIAVSSPRFGLWPWQMTSSVSAGWRLGRRWCHLQHLIFVYPWKYLSSLPECCAAVSGSRGFASHIDRQSNWKSWVTVSSYCI